MNNYFKILDLEEKIILSYQEIENAYVVKQIEFFHDTEMQEILNKAFQFLTKPLLRIEHFFEINNYLLQEKADKELLMEFFELNEQIENLDNKFEIINKLQKEIEKLVLELNASFVINDDIKLNIIFTRLKYINRIIENHRDFG